MVCNNYFKNYDKIHITKLPPFLSINSSSVKYSHSVSEYISRDFSSYNWEMYTPPAIACTFPAFCFYDFDNFAILIWGFPGVTSAKEPAGSTKCKGYGFDPWVGPG